MDYIRIFYFINKNRKKENCFISIIILTIKRMWCYTWTKIFLNYISFIRLTFCKKIHSLYNDRNIFSRVLFTFPRSISHESFFFLFPEIITRSRRFDMQVRWIMQLPAPLSGSAALCFHSEIFYYAADVRGTAV